ncbi:cell cycle control protein [Drechmeria coniospora]|uniref:Cell cycle control protein n=1 Tax=Drechmeria coniospora TaxID=98403 RepID=A0A151GHM5_DRECN|nr:cell cycle control protein [Drechmeria coniospora]KYK56586.1 cell cycle control protein [Drechmeria coniospora]ODA77027.1 hypothetical protein RJ55_07544 [Drechmeria coniospora]
MAQADGSTVELASDDDLIEIDATPATRSRNNLAYLLNPLLPFSPTPFFDPLSRRSERRQAESNRQTAAGAGDTTVIDLTQEPEDVDAPSQQPAMPRSRMGSNPRRTQSQRASAPRLARSDSTTITPSAVIDLTVDSPEDRRQADMTNQLRARPPSHHHHHHHHHRQGDHLIGVQLSNSGLYYHGMMQTVRRIGGLLGSELFRDGFNSTFDFGGSFTPGEASPKPPMEETPSTRPGYTRDTCAKAEEGLEMVAICPACNEELAYDPAGPSVPSSTPGGRRKKKAAGEHHFWALKKCGHVYCADCFENRKPTKAQPDGVGFRGAGAKLPSSAPGDLTCAVEQCDTRVTAKTEWVGIFL